MIERENDNFWIGLAIGAIVPVVGFIAIEQLFSLLTSTGLMDEVSASTFGRRNRTSYLIAIACNIIPVQIVNNQRKTRMLKGVITGAFVYMGFWLYRYYEVLMYNF